ncbi:MAG: hypothetical protein MZW92_27195 [Comamonadaceae bacterium]|nr:hypothetical protein [Comamonadaceae bacterium]
MAASAGEHLVVVGVIENGGLDRGRMHYGGQQGMGLLDELINRQLRRREPARTWRPRCR